MNWLRKRFAVLDGAQKLVSRYDMSRFLHSLRFLNHLARLINQRFPNTRKYS